MDKFYKIVFGFNEGDYLPIMGEELHKAQVIAIQGGKATFKAGFFNNRGNDVMRIVPDWHKARGWNKGHKMDEFDYKDIEPLQEDYLKTLENGKFLAEFIIKNNRNDLLQIPATEAFREVMKLNNKETKQFLDNENKQLTNKFQIN